MGAIAVTVDDQSRRIRGQGVAIGIARFNLIITGNAVCKAERDQSAGAVGRGVLPERLSWFPASVAFGGEWINRIAIVAQRKVKMREGGLARLADQPESVADSDLLPVRHAQ